MKLSETRHKHLVVTTPTMAECVGFDLVVCMIAAGQEITEVRLLTDDAIQTALQEASEDMKRGHTIRDEVPIVNNGELVEIDITREQAQELIRFRP